MQSDWRDIQRRMFGYAELEQDSRIKHFFKASQHEPTYLYGDTDYFNDYFTNKQGPYKNGLLIFNREIEITGLINTLEMCQQHLIGADKLCVAINKFCIYAERSMDSSTDYETALLDLIRSRLRIFSVKSVIDDKNLKGDRFNFASPYTQIYFENGNT